MAFELDMEFHAELLGCFVDTQWASEPHVLSYIAQAEHNAQKRSKARTELVRFRCKVDPEFAKATQESRRIANARYQARLRADPQAWNERLEYKRAKTREYRSCDDLASRERARARERYAAMMADPKRAEAYRAEAARKRKARMDKIKGDPGLLAAHRAYMRKKRREYLARKQASDAS